MNPYLLLGTYPDRTQPLVTHYSGPASRVELSVASVANAVAKAAGMLRDGKGVEPGAVVSIDLPRHWQLPVWTLAALSVGARCRRAEPGVVDVRIVGPEGVAALASGADPRADELLASACDPFGRPLPAALAGSLPAGAMDLGLEVPGYPDRFVPEPGVEAESSLVVHGREVPWPDLVAGGAPGGPGLDPGARLWVDASTADADLLVTATVVPLLLRGSVVLASGLTVDESAAAQAAEGVTAVAR